VQGLKLVRPEAQAELGHSHQPSAFRPAAE
jgi:hypothetical protein